MAIRLALLATLLAVPTAYSSEALIMSDSLLISGTETTVTYLSKVATTTEGDETRTHLIQGSITLRNGMYLMSDGSCVDANDELLQQRRVSGKDGFIVLIDSKHQSHTVNCPSTDKVRTLSQAPSDRIYLLGDGSCVEHKIELIETRRVAFGANAIELATTQKVSSTVQCPTA